MYDREKIHNVNLDDVIDKEKRNHSSASNFMQVKNEMYVEAAKMNKPDLQRTQRFTE